MTFMTVHDGTKPLLISTPPGKGSFPTDTDIPRSIGDVQHGDTDVLHEWDDDWTLATYVNGWATFGSGYGPARFRRLFGGLIRIEGMVTNGSVNTPIFYLPVGYRPSRTFFILGYSSGSGSNRLQIRDDGVVFYPFSGSTSWHSVECTFHP